MQTFSHGILCISPPSRSQLIICVRNFVLFTNEHEHFAGISRDYLSDIVLYKMKQKANKSLLFVWLFLYGF